MRPAGRVEEVFCPRCKRYVGTLEKCPYCMAKVPKRLAFRLLKWGGLAVAILGVLFLYVDVRGPHILVRSPFVVSVGDLYMDNAVTMNFAQVIITGKATFVKYYEDMRALGMYLTDFENENQEIYVRAYDTTTFALFDMERARLAENSSEPKFPAVGDSVTLRGNIRIRASGEEAGDFRMFYIQYPEGVLKIERPTPKPVSIAQINSNPDNFELYERIQIEGKIISTGSLGWATVLNLYEMSTGAEASVMVPSLLDKFGGPLSVKVGDLIRVNGAIQYYYGTPQIWLASWDDLEVVG